MNWNAGATLRACLTALFASEGGDPPQVIVVDNASTDGSLAGLTSTYPALEIVRNAENVGFARAVNQGFRAVRGQFALLLNPDVILLPSALLRLTQFMTAHPEAGIAGPRLLDPDGTVQGSARRDPSAWTALFGRSAPLTRLFPNNPVSKRELPARSVADTGPVEVDWLSGACLVARRAAWEQVGLLDERFFLFWEDADWCVRFRRAGWGVYYVPAASGTHFVGVSRARPPAGLGAGLPRERLSLLPEAPPGERPPPRGAARRRRAPGQPGVTVRADPLDSPPLGATLRARGSSGTRLPA